MASHGSSSRSLSLFRPGMSNNNEEEANTDTCNTGNSKRKTRGPSMCKTVWHMGEKRYTIIFNSEGQDIGDQKLSTSCGVVSRMGILCPISPYKDWRKLLNIFRAPILSYMRERYIIPVDQDKEDYILKKIGHCWNNYKCKLRKNIRILFYEKEKRLAYIRANVPEGVQMEQWLPFIDDTLDKNTENISQQKQDIRAMQNEFHTCGSKSYAKKRKEMELEIGGKVSDVDFYVETHTHKKTKLMDETPTNILDLKLQLSHETEDGTGSTFAVDDDEILRMVRGPEHNGRIRGKGMGPTPSRYNKYLSSKSLEKFQALTDQVEILTKSNEMLAKSNEILMESKVENDAIIRELNAKVNLLIRSVNPNP